MFKLGPGRFLGSRDKSRETARFRVSETSYEQGAALPRHCHESGHFCLVVDGYYTERLGGTDHERSPLDCIWYPAEVDHAESHASSGRHILLEIDPSLLRGLTDEEAPSTNPLVLRKPAAWRVTALLLDELAAPAGALNELAIEGLGFELLAEARPTALPQECVAPQWLHRVDELLESSFRRTISLAKIARDVGVHRCHLARTYRRWRHTSIGHRVRQLRVEDSCRLLAGSDRPLADIAYTSGFSDQAHLSKIFKQQIGLTPGRYRDSWRRSRSH